MSDRASPSRRPARRPHLPSFRRALGTAAVLAGLGAHPAGAAEIWFGGVDPFVRQVMQPGAPSDYTDLFRPDAPWSKAAAQVKVFETSTQFVNRGSDEQVRRMLDDLRQRHMKLALGALMQTQPPNCGQNVEGYAAAGAMAAIAEKIKRLGSELDYVAMDEPLWFGHRYDGPQACHASIADIARNVAGNVAAIRRVFPAVRIGDQEPFPVDSTSPAWLDEIAQWIAAYRAATGENLAFLQTDMGWHVPWRQPLGALSAMLTAAGITYGVIYDGDPDAPTGLAWAQQAEQRFVAVESDPATTPAQAVLYSWMLHPAHFLPESQPGTMTWLVNRYAAADTHLTLQLSGDRLAGQLMGPDEKPLFGQRLEALAVDNHNEGTPTVRTLMGVVPPDADHALFILRINAECECSGPADVTLGTLHYKDAHDGQQTSREFAVRGIAAGNTGLHIVARAGQPFMPNTVSWPVKPGDPWTAQVTMGASAESLHSGYVALVFMRKDGREIHRFRMRLEPATIPLRETTTDATGHYTLPVPAALMRLNPGFKVEYAGGDLYRMSEATLP
jgi:hypothetical protein